MDIQTKDAILKYLKDAIDQETAIVQQEQLIQQADAQHLQIKPSFKSEKAKMKSPRLVERGYANKVFIWSLVLGLILVLIGLIWASTVSGDIEYYTQRIAESPSMEGYYKREYLNDALQTQKTGNTIRTIGFLCLIVTVISVFTTYFTNKEEERKYIQESKAYDSYITELSKENIRLKKVYQKQLQEWGASFSNMRAYMHKPLSESRTLLTSFYASDVIYPKYRTLPALTSIYEYFITGRCDELTGPHGAYNLYEDELRKDTVISQLNTVIENLEQIKQNQYMLYQQVKAIQENTAAITYELQQIKGYTIQIAQLSALNAYYAALNERNTRITMYYHL